MYSIFASAPAPTISESAVVYASPQFAYSKINNSSAAPPAIALFTTAGEVWLLTVADIGTSVASLPSAILPKFP